MLKIETFSVMNFENAVRGMRNPMNSWAQSDSRVDGDGRFVFGEADLALAKKLCAAGSDHRKFLRQILVSVDILAPLYWWKEFDTYKVATVANSTSTMHKIHSKPFSVEDFSHDKLSPEAMAYLEDVVDKLEELRKHYRQTKEKGDWYDIIQLLPSGYNQLRTVTLNYETLRNMHGSRRSHKLDEWQAFCDWIEGLPYAGELIAAK